MWPVFVIKSLDVSILYKNLDVQIMYINQMTWTSGYTLRKISLISSKKTVTSAFPQKVLNCQRIVFICGFWGVVFALLN